MPRLTHLASDGTASMVDVSEKPETAREAAARAEVAMKPETLRMITEGNAPKGRRVRGGSHRRHHGGQAHA